jgi:polyphosphate kinase
MAMIQKNVLQLQNKFEYTYHHILGELERRGIHIINELELNIQQAEFVKQYFDERVFPVLSVGNSTSNALWVLAPSVRDFPFR